MGSVVGESRLLAPILGGVGTFSIFWAFFGRMDLFANDRYATFIDLLSVDRVGSSFIVDLVIFALFQGWLVDDDLRRRAIPDEDQILLRNVAKFVPFFGLAYYIFNRPTLPSQA